MSLQTTATAPTTPPPPAVPVAPVAWDRASFWRFADQAKQATEALALERMSVLPHWPLEALQRVCTQYRFFTIDYIADLAMLVARLPFGGLRSLLSRILSEELGDGDASKAHPEVYDRFLASIGVGADERERCLPDNRAILAALSRDLAEGDAAFGVGLRGMGGECLCQTYLAVLHQQLRAHPWIRANEAAIDWEFWTIHAGEQDIVHGEMTRQAIDDYLRDEPHAVSELARGYQHSITAWNAFWQNIFDAGAGHAARAG